MEKWGKYFPYIVGAIILGVGAYLWKNNQSGYSESYAVIPPPDNSAATQSTAAQFVANTNAKLQAFGALTGLIGTKIENEAAYDLQNNANAYAFASQVESNKTQERIKALDVQNQQYQAKVAGKVAKNHSNTQAIASIAGTALMALAIFCYNDTEIYASARNVYAHGGV